MNDRRNNWEVARPGPETETENKRREVQVSEVREVIYTGNGMARIKENVKKITVEDLELERTVPVENLEERTIEAAAFQLGELFTKSQNTYSCTVCGRDAASGCSVCYIDYCSSECQNADWPRHKTLCAQIAKNRWGSMIKQEPDPEPEPERLVTDIDPNIVYNPIAIDAHVDPRRVIENHMNNYRPLNGVRDPSLSDPRLDRRRVEIEEQNHQTQTMNSRDPRLKLNKYNDVEKEKEIRPNIRVKVFPEAEPQAPPPPPLFLQPQPHESTERHISFTEDRFGDRTAPPPPRISTRDRHSSGPSSPPREPTRPYSRHSFSDPPVLNRAIFKPPLRRSDLPPRPPFGPTEDFISIKSDDVEMNSECENEQLTHPNHRRFREPFRGKRPLMRDRNDKENAKSPRHVDMSDIVYAKSEKLYPPQKIKVVGLVKESDEKYWVVEQGKYPFWKEIQRQLLYCSDGPVLTPQLNIVGACFYEHSWYRAKVILLRPRLKVQFIDFGNFCDYEGVIRDIPIELKKTKPLAFMIKFSDEVPKYKISRDFSGTNFEIEVTERTHEKVSICRLISDVVTPADTTMEYEEGVRVKREPGLDSESEMDVDNHQDEVSVFEALNFKKNAVVTMTEVYTINEVFVTPADKEFRLNFEKLKFSVDDYAHLVRSYMTPPRIGELCCARFEGNRKYYRAVVLTVAEDLCSVLFVDYGNEQETQLHYIKPLSEELRRLPYCAVKVPLKGLNAEVRPAEVVSYFNRLIKKEIELILSFDYDIKDGVLLTEDASGVVVNDFVTRIIVSEIQRTELFFEKDLEFYTLEIGDVKDLMVTYIEKDEYDKSGVFYMANPKCQHYKKVNKEYPPKIKEYVQQNREAYAPQEGELILAKYQGEWYRAINVEKLSDELFRVYFVDYGNESVCKTSCIRRIRKDLADAPCLAIKCCVTGNEKIRKDTLVHRDVFDYIESNLNNVLLSAKVTKVVDGCTRSALVHISLPEVDKVIPKLNY